jgi:hypothetical protein
VDVVILILLTNHVGSLDDLIKHMDKIYTNYFICHVLEEKYYKLKDGDYNYIINNFPDIVNYLKTGIITKCLEDMTCKQCNNVMVAYTKNRICEKCCKLNTIIKLKNLAKK